VAAIDRMLIIWRIRGILRGLGGQVALIALDVAAESYPAVEESVAELELREILRGTGVPEGLRNPCPQLADRPILTESGVDSSRDGCDA